MAGGGNWLMLNEGAKWWLRVIIDFGGPQWFECNTGYLILSRK